MDPNNKAAREEATETQSLDDIANTAYKTRLTVTPLEDLLDHPRNCTAQRLREQRAKTRCSTELHAEEVYVTERIFLAASQARPSVETRRLTHRSSHHVISLTAHFSHHLQALSQEDRASCFTCGQSTRLELCTTSSK